MTRGIVGGVAFASMLACGDHFLGRAHTSCDLTFIEARVVAERLRLYRLDRGEYPKSLEALVPKYLQADQLRDPWGEPHWLDMSAACTCSMLGHSDHE